LTKTEIIAQLPYAPPFLFVDELLTVDEHGAEGVYTFPEDAYFYKGHFKDTPVTPGVLLTECMAQIGVVCLGIYLLQGKAAQKLGVALSSSEVQYYAPVYPGEWVRVVSKKSYFRFQKLKCEVHMYNAAAQLVCKGTISGMLKSMKDA